jgi:hypothetical protein
MVYEKSQVLLKPDSAVKQEVLREGQTFRSEDNAFCL